MNINLMLEVPKDVSDEDLSDFLKCYNFSMMEGDPIPMEEGTLIYFIEGPKSSYAGLEFEVNAKGYKIWSDPDIDEV